MCAYEGANCTRVVTMLDRVSIECTRGQIPGRGALCRKSFLAEKLWFNTNWSSGLEVFLQYPFLVHQYVPYQMPHVHATKPSTSPVRTQLEVVPHVHATSAEQYSLLNTPGAIRYSRGLMNLSNYWLYTHGSPRHTASVIPLHRESQPRWCSDYRCA